MTSSIPNDSLQALLGIVNSVLLKTLERIYETKEGSFSQEEILKDKQRILNISNSILRTNDLLEKSKIILSDYYQYYQYHLDKYRDFLSTEELESLRWNLNYNIALAYVSQQIRNISYAFNENNLMNQSQNISQEMNQLSFILENHSKYLPQDVINLIKDVALETLNWPNFQPNRENFSEEINNSLTLLKHITRSVLWQLEHHEKEEKLSDAEFDNLLNETQGIWIKGDGLAYQQQVRTGNNTDNIKQEMTGQEAAQFLKIPYVSLVKLLEKGELSYHEVNFCKRISLEDLIVYKQKRDEQRRQGIKEFTAFLEEEGFYNDDYSMS